MIQRMISQEGLGQAQGWALPGFIVVVMSAGRVNILIAPAISVIASPQETNVYTLAGQNYLDARIGKGKDFMSLNQLGSEKAGIRASHSINDNKFYNCDVCWTCEFYDVEFNGCDEWYLFEGNPRGRVMFINIKRPEWYRCSHWKGKKNEKENNKK